MRALIVGTGAVGARVARQIVSTGPLDELVLVDRDRGRAEVVAEALMFTGPAVLTGDRATAEAGDVVVLAHPGGQREAAEEALSRGADVVSVSDSTADVRDLLDLDREATAHGRVVVVGAGFSPGLSCVLAARAASGFEKVEEIHLARAGTGGPACAEQRHRSLTGVAVDWTESGWQQKRARSGRQLCWFPDPLRGLDCYRADTPETLLLVPAFEGVSRVTARVAVNRRERAMARLPRLGRADPEGTIGAIRVEVRGRRGPTYDERVLGAVDRPAVAAGTVGALAARWVLEGRMRRAGAAGLASLVEPVPFLAALAERGVKAAAFEPAAAAAPPG